MRGGRVGSLAASPTLVGAVTVLVVVVAVFLAYQANQGLPFVPTYKISAELPDANTLVPGNEVRIGGIRVGQIKSVDPVVVNDAPCPNDPTRQCTAQVAKVNMELNQDLQPLPENSTLVVRSKSALGLKYLEIDRGNSSKGFEPGATMPLSAARPEPVEIDQVFNMFDDPTRVAIQQNLLEFGNALAGRGVDLNDGDRPAQAPRPGPHTGDEEPGGPEHRPLQLRLLAVGHRRRGRSGRADPGPALRRPRHDLRCLRPRRTALHPGVDLEVARGRGRGDRDACRPSGPSSPTPPSSSPSCGRASTRSPRCRRRSADSIVEGVKALPLSPALNAQLDPTAQSLLNLVNNAPARLGIQHLTEFNNALGPPLSFITPAQSVCNYATILFQQRRQPGQLQRRGRERAAVHRAPAPARRGQRDRPELRAGQRPGRAAHQLPPLQPLPEHRLAGPDARVRGGQRGLSPAEWRSGTSRATRGSAPPARSSSRSQTSKPKKKGKK